MILRLTISVLIVYQVVGLPFSKNTPTNRNKPSKPDEQYNLFEGDMRFPPPTARGVIKRGNSVPWPNGIVPYEIAPGYEPEQKQFIINTMQRMQNALAVDNTLCINFRPRTSSDSYHITIRNTAGCSSYVGHNPNAIPEHTVSLQYPGCIDHGRIMHELLHTLGFYHEQSRPDRDNYVKINTEHIESGMEHNFNKYDNSYVDTKNTPYDYESVMHYEKDAFTSNGLPTIEPMEPNVEIGQRIWMSALDIEEVRLVYNCSSNGMISPINPAIKTASNYSSALTTDDEIYMRLEATTSDYYYEAVQIVASRKGIYDIRCSSNMDTLGYLYEGAFDASNPSLNLYKFNDDDAGNDQFKISAYLEAGVPYTLVVSTYRSSITGPFAIVTTGPDSVEYISMDIIVTTTTSTTIRPAIIYSSYSNELTLNSATFSRDGAIEAIYYYNAIEVSVGTSGTYTFESSSSVDAYGYLYQGNFYSSYPSINVMLSDDDSAGSRQFKLTGDLQSDTKYILVFTTFGERTTGQFNIIASGPDDVSFTQ